VSCRNNRFGLRLKDSSLIEGLAEDILAFVAKLSPRRESLSRRIQGRFELVKHLVPTLENS
jgi:hypothetical protein